MEDQDCTGLYRIDFPPPLPTTSSIPWRDGPDLETHFGRALRVAQVICFTNVDKLCALNTLFRFPSIVYQRWSSQVMTFFGSKVKNNRRKCVAVLWPRNSHSPPISQGVVTHSLPPGPPKGHCEAFRAIPPPPLRHRVGRGSGLVLGQLPTVHKWVGVFFSTVEQEAPISGVVKIRCNINVFPFCKRYRSDW